MATNIELEESLIKDAMRLGRHRSKRATVEEALREYVQHRKQLRITGLFGKLDWDESYDYKAGRHRKNK
jgi:Arc/MetJ family transcription regulator